MNRFITLTTKTLALLVILLLPVQQSLASNYCFHSGVDQSTPGRSSVGSMRNCCSQSGASRRSTCDLGQSCCKASSSDSNSRPCQCPCGCCSTAAPDAIASPANSSIGIDLSATAVPSFSTTTCESGPQNSQGSTIAISTASGSVLCDWLCRYRL